MATPRSHQIENPKETKTVIDDYSVFFHQELNELVEQPKKIASMNLSSMVSKADQDNFVFIIHEANKYLNDIDKLLRRSHDAEKKEDYKNLCVIANSLNKVINLTKEYLDNPSKSDMADLNKTLTKIDNEHSKILTAGNQLYQRHADSSNYEFCGMLSFIVGAGLTFLGIITLNPIKLTAGIALMALGTYLGKENKVASKIHKLNKSLKEYNSLANSSLIRFFRERSANYQENEEKSNQPKLAGHELLLKA